MITHWKHLLSGSFSFYPRVIIIINITNFIVHSSFHIFIVVVVVVVVIVIVVIGIVVIIVVVAEKTVIVAAVKRYKNEPLRRARGYILKQRSPRKAHRSQNRENKSTNQEGKKQ